MAVYNRLNLETSLEKIDEQAFHHYKYQCALNTTEIVWRMFIEGFRNVLMCATNGAKTSMFFAKRNFTPQDIDLMLRAFDDLTDTGWLHFDEGI